jgi:hypothetical protein
MSHKITVPMQSQNGTLENKEGLLMNIEAQNELWSEYTLEDGTIVRIKQAVVQVVRFESQIPNEPPQYAVQAQPIVTIIPKQ